MTQRMNLFLAVALFIGLTLPSCSNEAQPYTGNALKLQVTSPAFAQRQSIPEKYTGQGDDVSPPIQWTGAPANTKTFALICEDPDAPMGTFTHWVLFNLPPSTTALPENVAKTGTLPDGSKQGENNFNQTGYDGPMPPPGRPHRYFFRVYALDAVLPLDAGVKKADLLDAMKGHVLAEGELMGTYQRQ